MDQPDGDGKGETRSKDSRRDRARAEANGSRRNGVASSVSDQADD
jgi:hypothetical protein